MFPDPDETPAVAQEIGTPEAAPETPAEPRPRKPLSPEVLKADKISARLGEKLKKPRSQVRKLARVLGIEGLKALYERTMEIEANGGMTIDHWGTVRRRTPGGVFFFLSHDLLDDEQYFFVFRRRKRDGDEPLPRLASKPKKAPVEVIPFDQLPPEERASMTIPGKLELTLKISQLPPKVHQDKDGWKIFAVACGAQEVTIRLRPKMFNKITDAATKWPQWVATITGTIGTVRPEGFELLEPNVLVFERKTKTPEATPAPPKPAS